MKFASFQAISTGLAFLVVGMTGCQSPYSKFYTNSLPPKFERYLLPHIGETQYYSTSIDERKAGIEAIVRRGYNVIGYASFEGNAGDYTSSLHAKAKEVQADIVLLSSSYAGTRSGVMPLVTYQPGQSSTTYASGQIGGTNYTGTSTTTSPGTINTTYVPYNIERDNYSAIFFRKYHYLIGARWHPLNDDQRRELQRNAGLVVDTVIDGTPAFVANVLPGDILLTMDGDAIISTEWLNTRSVEKAGQVVKFLVLRNGVEKIIELRINPDTP